MPSDNSEQPAEHDGIEQPSSSQAMVPYTYPYANDEIDLVELGVSLWRRWKLMLVVFLLCVVGGLAFAFLSPRTYGYTAVIQIGSHSTPSGSQIVPMESPQSAVVTLNNAYLPEEAASYADRHGLVARSIKIKAANPEKTQVIVLSGTATSNLGVAYKSVEAAAAKQVVADDARVSNVVRSRLEQKLEQAKTKLNKLQNQAYTQAQVAPIQENVTSTRLKLESLQDPANYQKRKISLQRSIADAKATLGNLNNEAQVLQTRKKTLQDAITLRKDQEKELTKHLSKVRNAILNSAKGLSGPSQAMSALLLSTEEQRTVNQLDNVENQLTVALPQKMAALAQKIAKNQRQMALQKQQISEAEQNFDSFESGHKRAVQRQKAALQAAEPKIGEFKVNHQDAISDQKARIQQIHAQIKNIQQTKLATPPSRSVTPAGVSRGVIAVLAAVLGVIFALLAAVGANYISAVRKRLHTSQATPTQENTFPSYALSLDGHSVK